MEQNSSYYKDKYVSKDWYKFVKDMKRDGTHGDHVTLHALCMIFNVDILVVSSKGRKYTRLVSLDDS